MTFFARVLVSGLLIATLGMGSAPAQLDEHITDFHSDIVVHEDASMTVTESITVNVQGFAIKRGIIRDFPTKYKDNQGNTVTVWFKLLEVRRNGVPEPYSTETRLNGVSIRIGDADVYLPHGEHTYSIRYRTSRQLGFFENHDELYWNVTGTGWTFPIDIASAEVILPEGISADSIRTAGYTGGYGAHGADYLSTVEGNRAWFETTEPLSAFSGLTIVVQWPPGYVERPTATDRALWWLAAWVVPLLGLVGVVGLLLYYWIAWLRVGVDPEGGFVVPENEPPRGLTPAALRFIKRMRFDRKGFTATVVSLAVRGYLEIQEDADEIYTLKRLRDDTDGLAPEERELLRALFTSRDTVVIEQDNHTKLANAQTYMERELEKQWHGVYFQRNRREMQVGMTLSIIWFALMIAAGLFPYVVARPVSQVLTGLVFAGLYIVFAQLMPRYTIIGRMFLDRIDGFKLALAGGSDDLGDEHHPDPTLVEQYLPYAIALEVHNEWSKRFERAMQLRHHQQVQADGSHEQHRHSPWIYTPLWYHSATGHSRFSEKSFSSFSNTFTSSLNTSISSASTPPGSSSGGGGGFSGGGGGGGGGSGW